MRGRFIGPLVFGKFEAHTLRDQIFVLGAFKKLEILQENPGCNPPLAERNPFCRVRHSRNFVSRVV